MRKERDIELLIANRVRIARDARNITQEQLAEQMGFKDRQTISTIENGDRAVKDDELEQFAKVLSRPLEFFLDKYLVVEEEAFSYRAACVEPTDQVRNKDLIAAYRRFLDIAGVQTEPVKYKLPLGKNSFLEEVYSLAEDLAVKFQMGRYPADSLEKLLKELNVKLLYFDGRSSISGFAYNQKDLSVIFVNITEAAVRRNWDIGHELFHILTWDTLPPSEQPEIKGPKPIEEKMADAFTAGLLMPSQSVRELWEKKKPQDLAERLAWIEKYAPVFKVSGESLYWRLINLKLMSDKLNDQQKASLSRHDRELRPKLFNQEFMKGLSLALKEGNVSVRWACELLEMSVEDIKTLMRTYSIDTNF